VVLFCPLASGSKGNAALIHYKDRTFLFDVGISLKALHARFSQLNIPFESLEAIFISHEHHDHISGLKPLLSRYQIPVITNYATAEAIVEAINFCPQFYIFTSGEPFSFSNLSISPFSIQHDGIDPVAFRVTIENISIGICTDLGFITNRVRHELQNCHILYIEANHQPEMVERSLRPEKYKRRVLSRTGHLSNIEAAQLLSHISHPQLQKVYLAHLSSECNTPEKAIQIISEYLDAHSINLSLEIARQDQISSSITI